MDTSVTSKGKFYRKAVEGGDLGRQTGRIDIGFPSSSWSSGQNRMGNKRPIHIIIIIGLSI